MTVGDKIRLPEAGLYLEIKYCASWRYVSYEIYNSFGGFLIILIPNWNCPQKLFSFCLKSHVNMNKCCLNHLFSCKGSFDMRKFRKSHDLKFPFNVLQIIKLLIACHVC